MHDQPTELADDFKSCLPQLVVGVPGRFSLEGLVNAGAVDEGFVGFLRGALKN